MTAGGVALVRRAFRICGHEGDYSGIDVQFLGGTLKECRPDALAELRFAGEYGDAPLRVYGDPGIEHWRLLEIAGQFRLLLRARGQIWQQRKTHNQRATAGEQFAAG